MRTIAFSILLCLLSACAHSPEMIPLSEQSAAEIQKECESIFPGKDWQLFHQIQARLPHGKRETFLGITQISIEKQEVNCVLMTIEGLVLFSAGFNGTISVQRAVPPFDKKGFAEGMLTDIGLIFFKPQYLHKTAGIKNAKETVCRYELSNGDIEEIILLPNGLRELHLFNAMKELRRSVVYQAEYNVDKLAEQIELQAHGFPGYFLKLMLIEAVPLN
jgi:hypothetical protein